PRNPARGAAACVRQVQPRARHDPGGRRAGTGDLPGDREGPQRPDQRSVAGRKGDRRDVHPPRRPQRGRRRRLFAGPGDRMIARILIIDDEGPFRSLARLALESSGYEVGEAPDGESGLRALDAGWDAVLLDQRMPGMDGLEVLRRIHERSPSLRVIMAT